MHARTLLPWLDTGMSTSVGFVTGRRSEVRSAPPDACAVTAVRALLRLPAEVTGRCGARTWGCGASGHSAALFWI
jgi:hypothetical protein